MFDRSFIVLELASILAGPTTGMFFAELGARVIKIENPHTGGDPTRAWKLGAESNDTDVSAYFSCANWGKESLGCDLTQPAGRALAHDLAARADVVIASFKPGDETRLGLDYATLAARNPRLVYGQITAYGSTNPRPGFDAIVQAESGFTFLNGEPDGPPTKMPVALIDLLAAHQLKEGLLLALLGRERSGKGAHVTVSLLDAGIASLANQATNYLVADHVPSRMGSEHPNIVPYGSILGCRDGREVVIAAATERQYRELVAAIGLEALADDPRFASGQMRVRNRDALLTAIRARAAELDADDLAERLRRARVPFGFVNDMAAVFAQPGADDLLMRAAPGGSHPIGVRSFVARGATPPDADPSPPPHYNQHADSILGELLGYDDRTVEDLRAAGVLAAG